MAWHPWRSLRERPELTLKWAGREGLLGTYDVRTDEIVMDPRQSRRQRRCTLTHELIHAERRDGGCATSWHRGKQERSVDREAARRLIPLPVLIDALRWTNRDQELAEILDVDLDTLHCRSLNFTAAEIAEIEHQLWDEWSSA